MNSNMANGNCCRNQVWSVTQKVQTYNSTTSKRNVSVDQMGASTNLIDEIRSNTTYCSPYSSGCIFYWL